MSLTLSASEVAVAPVAGRLMRFAEHWPTRAALDAAAGARLAVVVAQWRPSEDPDGETLAAGLATWLEEVTP